MIAILSSFLLLAGALFGLIAALGIVRMPDIYCRMHAATKAGAFGVTLMLLALFAAAPSIRVGILCILIVAFFYLTAPIAAHMIGRVAISRKVPLWKPKPTDKPKPK